MGRVLKSKAALHRDSTPYAKSKPEGPREFVCKWDVCQAKSTSSKFHDRHMEIHGLKPAECKVCGNWYPRDDALIRHQDKQFKYCKGPGGGDAANKTRLRASTFWEVLLKQVGEERANAYVEEAKQLKITIWSGQQHGVSYGHPPSTNYFVPPKVKEPAPKRVRVALTPTVGYEGDATPADLPDLPPSRSATPEPKFSANVREEFNHSYGDYADYFSAYPLTRFNPCPPVAVKMSDMV